MLIHNCRFFTSHRDNITLGHHNVVVLGRSDKLFAVGKPQGIGINREKLEVSLQETLLYCSLPTTLWWSKVKKSLQDL